MSSHRLSASSLCTMRLHVRCGRMPVCSSTQARPVFGTRPAKSLPSCQPSAAHPKIPCGSATGLCQQSNRASLSWAPRWDRMRLCAISSMPNAGPRTACCRAFHAFMICRLHGCCCSFAQRLAPTTFSGLCRLTSRVAMPQCMMRPSHAASLLCSIMGKGPCHNTAYAPRSWH